MGGATAGACHGRKLLCRVAGLRTPWGDGFPKITQNHAKTPSSWDDFDGGPTFGNLPRVRPPVREETIRALVLSPPRISRGREFDLNDFVKPNVVLVKDLLQAAFVRSIPSAKSLTMIEIVPRPDPYRAPFLRECTPPRLNCFSGQGGLIVY